ncbi:unnamed protein product [Cylicostephanus goldi]|uniref:Protein kinase domain-containing protein n=1 Tax=Cylicostephanus goldi TaxID=71465 RepID=A0A3P6QI04_CYLGO|nr:unnamed protein product [Cylicostephanus goldi]
MRYCSINTQERGEQGRMDDLWSLLYILVEMRGQLPWAFATAVASSRKQRNKLLIANRRREQPQGAIRFSVTVYIIQR